MLKVSRIIDERREMNVETPREMLERFPGADLVALVRGVWNPVREIKNARLRHGKFRATKGPRKFAIGSGSFFHSATKRSNFGLFGLTFGTSFAFTSAT